MSLWDWWWPKRCVGCGKNGGYVCSECEVGLWEEEQACPACGRNSRYGLRHTYCRQNRSLEGLTALWAYEGIARKLIWKAKYQFYFTLVEPLLEKETFSGRPERKYWQAYIQEKGVVVPVPLAKKREQWRGFNQAKIVAEELGKNIGWPVEEILIKVKDRGQQVGRSKQERSKAVEGVYKVKTEANIPQKVVLVDDVWTTGATMRECARVLKEAGCKKVWGWVLAK